MRHTVNISKAHNYLRIFDFTGEFYARVIRPFCRGKLYKGTMAPVPGTRRKEWKITHVFARSNYRKDEYRIPASLFEDFLMFMQHAGYNPSRAFIEDEPELEYEPAEFKFKAGYEKTREGQDEWIDYQLAPGPVKINNASTGYGKTYMALRTMLILGRRTLITIQPRYLTTWLKALGDIIDIESSDVLVWEQDICKLKELMDQGMLKPKIIIMTITRIDVHLKNMKTDPDVPCLDDVYKSLRCGLRIIDEGHEAVHQIFSTLMYGNFPKLVLLSATLSSDDPWMLNMLKILFPMKIRLKEPEPENYIDIVALLYDINLMKYKLRCLQAGSYNDMVWEQSILDNPQAAEFYYQLAKYQYVNHYLPFREPGTKVLFFFSRVNMCDYMLERFKEDFPNDDFATFHGEDTTGKNADKLKYLKHEIVITTPGSCGTGKDIDGLIRVFCFHNVGSTNRNRQMIGRLRDKIFKLFNDRINPMYFFTVCVSQPKHKDYYEKRKVAFAAKQKSWKTFNSGLALN